jgi:hypothetical protein
MTIRLTYGTRQRFRYRYRDLTIRGQVDGLTPPVRRAVYRLNDGPETPFYVEEIPDDGIDWVNGYKTSPAERALTASSSTGTPGPCTCRSICAISAATTTSRRSARRSTARSTSTIPRT